ncbi:hypothetical protein LTR95_002196 [Oleoguttula sp. CCFEE 5521]
MAETEEAQSGVPIVSTTAILAEKQNQIYEHEHDTALQGGVPIIDSKDVNGSEGPRDELNDVDINDKIPSRPEAPSLHDSAIEAPKDHVNDNATINTGHTSTTSSLENVKHETGSATDLETDGPIHGAPPHVAAGSEVPTQDAALTINDPPPQLGDTGSSNNVSAGLTIPASVVDIPTQQAEADLAHGEPQARINDDRDPMDAEAAAQYDLPDQFADEQDLEVDVSAVSITMRTTRQWEAIRAFVAYTSRRGS